MYSELDGTERAGNCLSTLAGIFFGTGWWFFVDGVAYSRFQAEQGEDVVLVDAKQYLPGFGVTIALVMVCGMDWGAINADDFSYSGSNVATKARCFLGLGVVIAMASIVGAIVIIVEEYDDKCPDDAGVSCLWPGIAILLQTIFISLATFFLRCSLPIE